MFLPFLCLSRLINYCISSEKQTLGIIFINKCEPGPVTGRAKPCDFFLMQHKEPRYWYVVYTKPKWEKKVFATLQQQGIEAYCPLNRVTKKWSDRFKFVGEPLFKSYVFVHLSQDELGLVRYVNGIVNFIYWLGKPAKVNKDDIDRIKRFLNEHEDVRTETWEPRKREQVISTSGVMMDLEGTILSVGKTRVEVKLESLGCKLVAYIGKDKIQPKA